jgi:hypothetical protein
MQRSETIAIFRATCTQLIAAFPIIKLRFTCQVPTRVRVFIDAMVLSLPRDGG